MKKEEKAINSVNAERLLKDVVLFSKLNEGEVKDLARRMEGREYETDVWIVKEGEIGGDVYFVVEGTLEVSKKNNKQQDIHLAVLGPGDTIGLSQTGFYSSSGFRVASVRTLSRCVLFRLTIDNIRFFLEAHPGVNEEMRQVSELMARAQLIKGTVLFSSLPPAAVNTLSRNIESVHVPAQTTIFREGEAGDKCYLIRSGAVIVSAKNIGGKERTLSTLHPPMLFGETALLTEMPRNATVRSLTPCELLVIRRDQLLEVLKQEPKIAESFSALQLARSRPKKNPHVSIYYRQTPEGEVIAILKQQQNSQYYRLSRVGIHIWNLLNGKNTLQEIATSVFENFSIFSPESVLELVAQLSAGGFIQTQPPGSLQLDISKKKLSWAKKMLLKLTAFMEAQYSLKNVDQLVTTVYRHGGYLFFTIPALFLFLAVIIVGVVNFIQLAPTAIAAIKTVNLINIIIVLTVMNFIAVFLHEFSHALATKSFGFQVHRFGIGWYWLGPIAFTDTSDMWLSTRWPRMVVNAAGIYTDATLAGIACLAASFVATPSLLFLFWLFALSCYLTVLKNLDPTLEFDGYYILMDLMDKPNLRQAAVRWLTDILPKNWRTPGVFRTHLKEILYWVIAVFFLIFSVEVTIFFQTHFMHILYPHVYHSNWYTYFIYWVLPVLVIIFASLGVWVEMIQQRAHRKVFIKGN